LLLILHVIELKKKEKNSKSIREGIKIKK